MKNAAWMKKQADKGVREVSLSDKQIAQLRTETLTAALAAPVSATTMRFEPMPVVPIDCVGMVHGVMIRRRPPSMLERLLSRLRRLLR